jgi:hypothetical protein
VREQLEFYERRVDSFAEGVGAIAAKGARTVQFVPGVYDSIDPAKVPQGWTFKDVRAGKKLTTYLTGPNGAEGKFVRSYDPQKKEWTLDAAFFSLDLPNKVQDGVEMLPGKGTPPIAYLDMRLMKMAGIQSGSLSKVKMSTIQNIEAICQVHQAIRQGATPNEALALTHSVAYAQNEIVQSGHNIASIEMVGGTPITINDLLTYYEDPMRSHLPSYRSPAAHDAILQRYGFSRSEVMMYDFDIVISLSSSQGTP